MYVHVITWSTYWALCSASFISIEKLTSLFHFELFSNYKVRKDQFCFRQTKKIGWKNERLSVKNSIQTPFIASSNNGQRYWMIPEKRRLCIYQLVFLPWMTLLCLIYMKGVHILDIQIDVQELISNLIYHFMKIINKTKNCVS